LRGRDSVHLVYLIDESMIHPTPLQVASSTFGELCVKPSRENLVDTYMILPGSPMCRVHLLHCQVSEMVFH
jgi:hypothetical protein